MSEQGIGEAPESLTYVIQNLKAVYGVPELEGGLDPLDVLVETILSQSTTNVNSQRAFASLKQKFPTWEAARRARVTSIEAAIRSGGLAKQKSVRIKRLLHEIYERRGSLHLHFPHTAPPEEGVALPLRFQGGGP